MTTLKRFMHLFRGNGRSYGVWDPMLPKSRSMRTVKDSGPEEQQYRDHLSGTMGLGVVPIRDDGTCCFGAIDIDNHKKGEDLDLAQIEQRVKARQLPLVVCRSKSGGAHLYLFGFEPLRADIVRTVMNRWMVDLQIEGSDCVFPKQDKLIIDGEGNRALGNWINLPYFNAEKTDRYMVENGEPCPFELFLTLAEEKAITPDKLEEYFVNEHSEAPPCIQQALKDGVGRGYRNDGLFHITVYNRKRNPESVRTLSHSMQTDIFDDPLPFPEADRVIRSAAKKSYGYLCKKEPWREWCDKDICRRRKYGISESEYQELAADSKLPIFSDLVKYMNTDPVQWELKMNGVPVMLSTDELMDYRAIRTRAAERLHMILPTKIKSAQWTDEILAELMINVRFEEAPDDPLISMRMDEFLRKADLTSDGTDTREREAILRGMPVVMVMDKVKCIAFRGIDFEDYLKRTKTDIPRNKHIWHGAQQSMGIKFGRIRIKGRIVRVWYTDQIPSLSEQGVADFEPEY